MRTPEKKALLTGAGFTKNFGGFLADDMSDVIFNSQHLRNLPVRDILKTKSNYEAFYEDVFNGNFTNEEKGAVTNAVFEAYGKLDKVIRNFVYQTNNQVHLNGVNNLIDMFVGGPDKSGYYFTLNQDLFIERHYFSKASLVLPCIYPVPRHKSPLETREYVTLPTEQELNKKINDSIGPLSTSNFYYIKLHGSFNWESSDGSQQMVVGPGKEAQIDKEPLLKWYNNIIFPRILQEQNFKLLVIGYSFGDEHINYVISESIKNNNLKLYVISPQNRVEFINALKQCAYGDVLSGNLEKYFPYDLFKIFPGDQSKTQAWEDIREAIS